MLSPSQSCRTRLCHTIVTRNWMEKFVASPKPTSGQGIHTCTTVLQGSRAFWRRPNDWMANPPKHQLWLVPERSNVRTLFVCVRGSQRFVETSDGMSSCTVSWTESGFRSCPVPLITVWWVRLVAGTHLVVVVEWAFGVPLQSIYADSRTKSGKTILHVPSRFLGS